MAQFVSLSLKRNFSWTILGNLVYAGSQWGILVALTKLGSPVMVGQFTLGLAMTAPIFMLTNLQLRQVQATDAKSLYRFQDYLGLRLLCTLVAWTAAIVITVFTGYRYQTLAVILLIGVAKGLESISDICYGLFQHHERMDRIAASLMMRGPLALLGMSCGVWLSHSAIGGVLGMILAWGAILLGHDLPYSARFLAGAAAEEDNPARKRAERFGPSFGPLRPHWSLKLWPLVRLAFPLGLVMMMFSLSSNLPSYFIAASLGQNAETELGIFNAIAYIMVAGNIVVNALGDAASPRLAKHYAAGKRSAYGFLLLRLVGIGTVIGVLMLGVAVVGGGSLLSLIYSPAYAQRQTLFIWLMAGSGIQYVASFLGYGMTAARYFRVQVPLLLTSMICLALTCLWLIPAQGLIGAAAALMVAAVVNLVMSAGVILHALLSRPHPAHIPTD